VGAVEGKVAVVVGGTSGIGAATARLLAQEGARVVVAGRRPEAGAHVAADIGSQALFVQTDVTVDADVEGLMMRASERFGRIDCLINSAGGGGPQFSVTTLDIESLRHALAVHVCGVASAIRHAAPIMIGQRSGSIVTIASVAGTRAGWSPVDYSCAKAASIHLTRWAAVELGEHGIRANSVSPGPTVTGIFAKGAGINDDEADRTASELTPVFESALARWRPLARVATPDDVAAAAVWLASDASGLVTGQDLAVDAGLTAGPPASVLTDAWRGLIDALTERARAAHG
jgi:NAD(P)-dependent dehydrogenase (short-subunit alcohol dehydrogenase family)